MLLNFLIILPLFTALWLLLFTEAHNKKLIREVSLYSALFSFFLSIFLWAFFDKLTLKFQFLIKLSWIFHSNIFVGIDGISLFFILLVIFITLLCVLSAWRRKYGLKEFLIYLFLIEFFCLIVFTILDILVFYMFFESVLMPMFIMIGVWGSTYSGRVKAAYYFFLYTLAGSILFLVAIMLIYLDTGTTNLVVLFNSEFSNIKQSILFVLSFLGFAVKIPLFPIHIWLPEAHVEAPTEGSVILASLLLKLGGYGFLRVSLPIFPYGSKEAAPFIFVFCTLGVIYASLTTLAQVDLKKVVAYSSVAHMNLVVLGIFSLEYQGVAGSLFLMLGHGIISSGLFFLVGVLYDRHHTRRILFFGGIAQVMPLFSTFFLFFSLANMSFPGTCNFVGELLTLIGIFLKNRYLAFFAASGIVLSAAYSIWLFNRIVFGNLNLTFITKYKDLTRQEFFILIPLIFLGILLGIWPDLVLDYIYISIKSLVVTFFS